MASRLIDPQSTMDKNSPNLSSERNPLDEPAPPLTRSKQPLVVLAGLLMLVLVLNVLAATITTRLLETTETDGWAEVERLANISQQARNLQLSFKEQVHEWKNVLLRGHREGDYERYLAAFHKEESEVIRNFDTLSPELESVRIPSSTLEGLKTEHQRIGVRYREELARFKHNEPLHAFEIDHAIRGVDRDLHTNIDTLVDEIRQAVTERRLEVEARTRKVLSTASTVQHTLLIIGLALVVLILFFSVRNAKR